eukprot:CAMPEP_0198123836 /NCGR_PEP_ID=MMETSP1442-20131203/38474_1 /TAXON_ID= /ORGANISM="Craspedostauros australis, Strain CCMP3328" /LENGTH=266 /DNA_ID=CAMNT_0043783111 /DNA_START=52 /DNA_END=852 /DNA_ORIENTATION=+
MLHRTGNVPALRGLASWLAVLMIACCDQSIHQFGTEAFQLSTSTSSTGSVNNIDPQATARVSPDEISRRSWMKQIMVGAAAIPTASTVSCPHNAANAFDGSGSTASSGMSPATKIAQRKAYQERVVADVRDFNALGVAIATGETSGNAWVNFFIPFQRREPDALGRSYAALADFRGAPTPDPKVFEGGCGLLLATSFTKAGKPPDNTPAVKSFNKVYRTFDAVQTAGKKGDVAKAKVEYEKIKPLLTQYLADVDLPPDLADPIYQN